jgi:branched-chain amino acid transport system substrate-binding protein
LSKDDGYEPNEAIKNTREFIEKEKVFLLIGQVGTPTSFAVVPLAEEAKVPYMGPFSGAEFLRNPYKRGVINIRGSYYQEAEKLCKYLVDHKKLKKIACFYQNDAYGQVGLKGTEIALEKRGLRLVSTGTYERNSTAVKSGLLQIRRGEPEAVVMIGAYKPCADFIKWAKTIGMQKTVFCNVSFVGTEALRDELGNAGEGCIISQVVRFPFDETVPLVKEFQEDMKKYCPEGRVGFVSLEGYLVGKLFCSAAKAVEGELTRENFILTIQRKEGFELGGVHLQFGEQDNQGMDEIFLTIIKDSKIESFSFEE